MLSPILRFDQKPSYAAPSSMAASGLRVFTANQKAALASDGPQKRASSTSCSNRPPNWPPKQAVRCNATLFFLSFLFTATSPATTRAVSRSCLLLLKGTEKEKREEEVGAVVGTTRLPARTACLDKCDYIVSLPPAFPVGFVGLQCMTSACAKYDRVLSLDAA